MRARCGRVTRARCSSAAAFSTRSTPSSRRTANARSRRSTRGFIGRTAWPSRMARCISRSSRQSENLEVPSLGAQPAPFVLIQLYLFREKQRRVEPMTQAAQGLTDDDLRQFSEFIVKLPAPKPPQGAPDAARIERGRALAQSHRCGFCHSPDFSGHDNIPRLAAQREDYL